MNGTLQGELLLSSTVCVLLLSPPHSILDLTSVTPVTGLCFIHLQVLFLPLGHSPLQTDLTHSPAGDLLLIYQTLSWLAFSLENFSLFLSFPFRTGIMLYLTTWSAFPPADYSSLGTETMLYSPLQS